MRAGAIASLLLFILTGCVKRHPGVVDPIEPPSVARVSGVISYPDHSPAWMARVWVRDVDTVFTDSTGTYSLSLPISDDTLRVDARDGYAPGQFYVQRRWNAARVVPDRDRIVDIVLAYIDPI